MEKQVWGAGLVLVVITFVVLWSDRFWNDKLASVTPKSQQTPPTNRVRPHQTQSHDTSQPICSLEQLHEGTIHGEWVRKSKEESVMLPFSPKCRFMAARYYCYDGVTSASAFQFQQPSGSDCRVPAYQELLQALGKQRKRILFTGDSHVFQLYVTILCQLEASVLSIDYISVDLKQRHQYVKKDDRNGVGPPRCPAITLDTYDRFYDETWGTVEECMYHGGPDDLLCATLSDDPGSGRQLEICILYVRPLPKKEATDKALETIGSGNEHFDAIVGNSYIDVHKLATGLGESGYNGTVFKLLKYNAGHCRVVDKVPKVHVLSKKYPEPAKIRRTTFVQYQFEPMLDARRVDAHAVIYPFTGIRFPKKQHFDNTTVVDFAGRHRSVCCANQLSQVRGRCTCDNENVLDVKKCRNTRTDGQTDCNTDGHFCMPGPLDTVTRYVMTSWLGV